MAAVANGTEGSLSKFTPLKAQFSPPQRSDEAADVRGTDDVAVYKKPIPEDEFDSDANMRVVREEWEAALPSLQAFIRIPNTTVITDKDWETNGLLDKATKHVADWFLAQNIEGLTLEILKDPGYSPLLYVEIAATPNSTSAASTFLMYGHLDKQPHGPGWDADISPISGLVRDGKLYGRG